MLFQYNYSCSTTTKWNSLSIIRLPWTKKCCSLNTHSFSSSYNIHIVQIHTISYSCSSTTFMLYKKQLSVWNSNYLYYFDEATFQRDKFCGCSLTHCIQGLTKIFATPFWGKVLRNIHIVQSHKQISEGLGIYEAIECSTDDLTPIAASKKLDW